MNSAAFIEEVVNISEHDVKMMPRSARSTYKKMVSNWNLRIWVSVSVVTHPLDPINRNYKQTGVYKHLLFTHNCCVIRAVLFPRQLLASAMRQLGADWSICRASPFILALSCNETLAGIYLSKYVEVPHRKPFLRHYIFFQLSWIFLNRSVAN